MKTHWARHSEAAKEADRPQPNGDVERTAGPVSAGGGTRTFHRAMESNLTTIRVDLDQLGKLSIGVGSGPRIGVQKGPP